MKKEKGLIIFFIILLEVEESLFCKTIFKYLKVVAIFAGFLGAIIRQFKKITYNLKKISGQEKVPILGFKINPQKVPSITSDAQM